MAKTLSIHNSDELEMELAILGSFDWSLSSPTTKTFVDLFLCVNDQADDTVSSTFLHICSRSLAQYEHQFNLSFVYLTNPNPIFSCG